ncbi:MAG: hypothetical protein ACYDAO_02715 [Thermoplasmataceae archaeon]
MKNLFLAIWTLGFTALFAYLAYWAWGILVSSVAIGMVVGYGILFFVFASIAVSFLDIRFLQWSIR